MFDFMMWSSLVLDNVIKIAFVGAGVAIIYAALKPNKTEPFIVYVPFCLVGLIVFTNNYVNKIK
ncbi:hypothetical protein IGI01_19655 [Bacillus thuringiensis]|nr:hypothetical protein [Bacillus thuringiensis]